MSLFLTVVEMKSVADVAGLVHTDPNTSKLNLFFFSISVHCIALLFSTVEMEIVPDFPFRIIDIPGTEHSRYSLVLIKCGSFAVTAQDQPGDSHIYSTARNNPSDLVFLKSHKHSEVIPVRQVLRLHLAPSAGCSCWNGVSRQCRLWVFPTAWLLLCIHCAAWRGV